MEKLNHDKNLTLSAFIPTGKYVKTHLGYPQKYVFIENHLNFYSSFTLYHLKKLLKSNNVKYKYCRDRDYVVIELFDLVIKQSGSQHFRCYKRANILNCDCLLRCGPPVEIIEKLVRFKIIWDYEAKILLNGHKNMTVCKTKREVKLQPLTSSYSFYPSVPASIV